MTAPVVRAQEGADVDAILDLHAAAFGQARRSRAYWDWLIGRQGTVAVAMLPDGRCVGMYAGVRRRLWLDQREQRVMLGMDLAIAPDWRRGLAAGRMLVALSRLHGSMSADCVMVYGYPQPEVLRVLVGRMAFEVLGDVQFLVREPGRNGAAASAGALAVEALTDPGPEIDGFWQACRSRWSCTIVRDRHHWQHRFAEHPTVDYRILAARDGGRLRGLAAVRDGGIHRDALSIVDWLVAEGDDAAAAALLAAADEIAAARGRRAVVAWFRPCVAEFDGFQRRHGFRVVGSTYQVAFRPLRGGLRRVPLHERWHQTMADMDFF